jgi:hypothetical protein
MRSGEHASRPINLLGREHFTFAFSVCRLCSLLLNSEPFLLSRLRCWSCSIFQFFVPSPARMAPQQPLTIIDPLSWERSTATTLALGQLVAGGQLAANVDGQPPEWIVPSEKERVPNPPFGYIVSFTRGLCYHYGVELQNFAPNAISQAATFVGVCKGFLGIPVNWDLWVHLFRAELHTLPTSEPRTRRAARAGGLVLAVRSSRREEYIPCTMTTNNADWERGWFYLRNTEPGLPPTPARCSGRGPLPGTTGCPRPRTRRGWTRSWPH